MLNELKFVQGAVAKKDLLPAMTHFRIENGTVRSYNGTLAISSPIALDLVCCPKADVMVKAIDNCNGATTLTLTPSGKLSIRSGPFKVLVPTIQGETMHVDPAGEPIAIDGELLLKVLKILMPFVGNDASRPWTTGILLDGQSAYATNNVCLVQYWLGVPFPRTLNLPRALVKELLRVDEPPVVAQVDERSITFHYSDGRWIRSQLLDIEWPMERINKMLDIQCNPQPIDPAIFAGLKQLNDMTDGAGRIWMRDGALRTNPDTEEGASYELPISFEGCYNMKMLGLLEGVVTLADMTLYPAPCMFFGERMRGAIIGMMM